MNELDALIMLGKAEFERIYKDEYMDDHIKTNHYMNLCEILYHKVCLLSEKESNI